MKAQRILSVTMITVLVLLLQGCDQVKALLAFTGMAAGTALKARPDRSLSYQIAIATNDGSTLQFKGSTECSHSVNPNGYRGGYFTMNPSSITTIQDEEWILSGIDCDNEIVEKKPGQYLLYKVIDGRLAKVYFVMTGGPARVMKATFDSNIISSSKVPRSQGIPYLAGPYLYQKVYFSAAPAAVSNVSEPIVVYQGTSICGKQNSIGLSLSKEEFFDQFQRGTGMQAIEEGSLAYEHKADAWRTVEGSDPSTPMDAATYAPSSNAEILEHGCVRLIVNNQTFVVSESALGSFLYIPAEKAFYRVARTWYSDAQAYLGDQRAWSACPAPQALQNVRAGLIYRINEYFEVAKKTLDGGFLCRRNFRWLGAASF